MKSFLVILCLFMIFVAVACGGPTSKPVANEPQDPLVYKQINGMKIVRAVVGDRLFILVFKHQKGVWFLIAAKPAAELKN